MIGFYELKNVADMLFMVLWYRLSMKAIFDFKSGEKQSNIKIMF